MSLSGGGSVSLANKSVTWAHIADNAGIAELIAHDETSYSSADETGAWVTVATASITAAQADTGHITMNVTASLYATANSGTTAVTAARFCIGATGKGQEYTTLTSQNGLVFDYFVPMQVTLTAGTDYTRGTAFDVLIQHKGTLAGGATGDTTTYLKSIKITGWA
jgi:hypothetical protein